MGRTLSRFPARIDHSELRSGAEWLASVDPRLAALLAENGLPPLWARAEGFATVVKIVLEQQVSLASAAAAFRNLEQAIGSVEPEPFLTLGDSALKHIGFSRQKAGYCRELAVSLLEGSLDLGRLSSMGDNEARDYLTAIRGIGTWTAEVYLLFALQRPDVWPMGDRALVVSMAENLSLPEVPSYAAARVIADAWRPWRSVAARMLWHAYLARRGRSLI